MLGALVRFVPWVPTRALLWTRWGAYSAPYPQLEVTMTFGHYGSCLRHHGRYLLQKHGKLPGTLTNFKGVTVTISPLCYGPQLTLWCLKYIKGIFNPYAVWHSYFLIPRQSFYGKIAKLLEKIFFQLWKCNLVDFIEISGNRCANTNIRWRKLKHPT